VNLLNDDSGVRESLKGIDYRVATLSSNFRVPLLRDWLMAIGLVDVCKKSLSYLLHHGKSVMIVIGGAAEALDARPGENKLVLRKRKGFIRLALETGASLVPIYLFGENHLYTQVKNERGTKLRGWQDKLKDKLGFSMPLFHGRGIWNYDVGFLPFRHPIVTVIGKPIEVPMMENPTDDAVNKYHELYINSLTRLYEEYKQKYAPDDSTSTLELF